MKYVYLVKLTLVIRDGAKYKCCWEEVYLDEEVKDKNSFEKLEIAVINLLDKVYCWEKFFIEDFKYVSSMWSI